MATSHLQSTSVANALATPAVRNNEYLSASDNYETVEVITTLSSDAAGSTYSFGRVKSSARVSDLQYMNDAMTAGIVKLGVAVAGSNGATLPVAASDQIFASGVSLAAAHNIWTLVGFPSILGAGGLVANVKLRVWELLGLAADPMTEYEVIATVTTGVTTGGSFALRWQAAI